MDGIRHDLVSIYRSTFTRPPYNEGEEDVEAFSEKLDRHSARGGFRLCAAREEGEIVGFSYGFDGGRNGWTRSIIEPLLTDEETERWLADYFEFVELAVASEARGRGVGGRLHDELLSGVAHRRAALFAIEDAEPAMGLYRKRGWRTIVDGFRFSEEGRAYKVMTLDLGG